MNTEGVTRLRTSKGWISCKSNIVEDIGFTRPAPKNVDVVAGFAAGPEASVPAPISMSEVSLRNLVFAFLGNREQAVPHACFTDSCHECVCKGPYACAVGIP